jgi:hypothetical protein
MLQMFTTEPKELLAILAFYLGLFGVDYTLQVALDETGDFSGAVE